VTAERSDERFFADVDQVWAELSDEQRLAVGEVRAMLGRLGLPYARPEGTRATVHEDDPTRWLQIRHIADGLKLGVRLSPDEVEGGSRMRSLDMHGYSARDLEGDLWTFGTERPAR
jgi:hypothetical protein